MKEIQIKTIGTVDVVNASNGSLSVTIPVRMARRGRNRVITLPDGTPMQPRQWNNDPTPFQQALARAHRWLEMLESGKVGSLIEVAEKEGRDPAYVSRFFNLTTLAPDIVAAILDETLPEHVTLFDLACGTPLLWDEQRKLLSK